MYLCQGCDEEKISQYVQYLLQWLTNFSCKGPDSRGKNQVYYIGTYVTRAKTHFHKIFIDEM